MPVHTMSTDPRTNRSIAAVAAERERQRAKWGDAHDLMHPVSDWMALIIERLGERDERKALVEIAALAIAALDTLDSDDGPEAA